MKGIKFKTAEKVEKAIQPPKISEELPELSPEEIERDEEPEMTPEQVAWEVKVVEEHITRVEKHNPKKAEWLRKQIQMVRLPIAAQRNFSDLRDSLLLHFFLGLFAWAKGYDVKASGWLDNSIFTRVLNLNL